MKPGCAQLDEAIHKAPCIGLDESTDESDDAQLWVYVRFFNEEKKENDMYLLLEHILFIIPLVQ